RSIALTGSVCGPASYSRMTRAGLQKIGDSVKCRLYEPSSGPVRSTRTLVGDENVDGQKLLHVMWRSGDRETVPIWLFDNEGSVFQSERDLAGTKIVSRVTDRETALTAAANTESRDEFFGHTVARSNIRFADARAIDRLRVRITHKKPELGWP